MTAFTPRSNPLYRATYDHCPSCGVWDVIVYRQCPECWREANPDPQRRTWAEEIARDWRNTYQPWLYAQYQAMADVRHWPAPLLLIAFLVLVGKEVGRWG